MSGTSAVPCRVAPVQTSAARARRCFARRMAAPGALDPSLRCLRGEMRAADVRVRPPHSWCWAPCSRSRAPSRSRGRGRALPVAAGAVLVDQARAILAPRGVRRKTLRLKAAPTSRWFDPDCRARSRCRPTYGWSLRSAFRSALAAEWSAAAVLRRGLRADRLRPRRPDFRARLGWKCCEGSWGISRGRLP